MDMTIHYNCDLLDYSQWPFKWTYEANSRTPPRWSIITIFVFGVYGGFNINANQL